MTQMKGSPRYQRNPQYEIYQRLYDRAFDEGRLQLPTDKKAACVALRQCLNRFRQTQREAGISLPTLQRYDVIKNTLVCVDSVLDVYYILMESRMEQMNQLASLAGLGMERVDERLLDLVSVGPGGETRDYEAERVQQAMLDKMAKEAGVAGIPTMSETLAKWGFSTQPAASPLSDEENYSGVKGKEPFDSARYQAFTPDEAMYTGQVERKPMHPSQFKVAPSSIPKPDVDK